MSYLKVGCLWFKVLLLDSLIDLFNSIVCSQPWPLFSILQMFETRLLYNMFCSRNIFKVGFKNI